MAHVMALFLIILMGYLDRIRGTGSVIVSGDSRLMMGWCLACLYGHPMDYLTIGIAIAFALGEAPGWGNPISAGLGIKTKGSVELEWWQRGILKTNAWLALAARGVMWGAPVALLGYFDPALLWLPVIIGIAMPLAVWVVSLTSRDWGHQEILRGLLIGLQVVGVKHGWS